ncbi:MAG: xylulokinase, partial [Chloroflexi bacterium]
RAILEGVAYAFRDCLNTLRAIGPTPDRFLIGGGGAQGDLWRQILASVLGVSLHTIAGKEHTATGAAVLAGLGTHVFFDLPEAVARTARNGTHEAPNPDNRAVYEEGYARFRALYPALRALR